MLALDKQFAINLQLLGGVWILQTFPAMVFGLYTRWFHRWALLVGWAVGMVYGTVAGVLGRQPGDARALRRLDRAGAGARARRSTSASPPSCSTWSSRPWLTVVFRPLHLPEGADENAPHQYTADPESVVREPAITTAAAVRERAERAVARAPRR